MRNIVLKGILILSLLMFSASIVFAADGPLKIGIVNLNKAVNESEQGKKAKAELETFIKGKQEALDEKGRNIENLKAGLEKQRGIISAQAVKKKEDEISRLTLEYQKTVSDSQGEVRKKEGELTGRIVAGLKKIIETVASEEKYTVILDNNPAFVVFADKGLEITDMVIKRFDESQRTVK